MASLIDIPLDRKRLTILDPGAGEGALCIMLVNHIVNHFEELSSIKIIAYEIDVLLVKELEEKLTDLKQRIFDSHGVKISFKVRNENYLYSLNDKVRADVAIINPPYGKIKKGSPVSIFLKNNGLSSTNYYSSFIEVALRHTKNSGEVISIVPRSFMNGKYFVQFRNNVFNNNKLIRIHIFESRYLFSKVIQENVVIKIKKSVPNRKDSIDISHSYDDNIAPMSILTRNITEVIDFDNANIIRAFRDDAENTIRKLIDNNGNTLANLGNLQVSTGPVVDFRDAKNFIYIEYQTEAIPYIFQDHIVENQESIYWPKKNAKKGNFLIVTSKTERKIRPNGYYVVVKRFSPKESRHRVHAAVVSKMNGHQYIAFDNKLNYFHIEKGGLNENLALGLNLYLNSSMVEIYISQITGSTQINSSDLELLKYPSISELETIGETWKKKGLNFSQININKVISSCLKDWK